MRGVEACGHMFDARAAARPMIEVDFASSARGKTGSKHARLRERAMVRAPAKRRVVGTAWRWSRGHGYERASRCRVPPPCAANFCGVCC